MECKNTNRTVPNRHDLWPNTLRYQEKKLLDSFHTFEELLDKTSEIEKQISEKKKFPNSINKEKEQEAIYNKPRKSKVRCNYCKLIGHTSEVCRKRIKAQELVGKNENVTRNQPGPIKSEQPNNNKPVLTCYGCGEPGVVRSRCPKCNAKETPQTLSFRAINTNIDIRQRPTMPISVYGYEGMAYVDTCAKSSVASFKMFKALEGKGQAFKEETMYVTLADGIAKRQCKNN